MEIRNALILLTKVSNAFPVTRKSGINLEKRVNILILLHLRLICKSWLIPYLCPQLFQVAKLKSDEREDLKVLATGVAAALAARKVMIYDVI